MPPLVSIITVNYNESASTRRCLRSLRLLTYPRVEVFVVDNASDPGQASALQQAYPDATVVANPTNAGFAGGNNAVLSHTRGRYVLLLNNDALATPGMLEPLVEAMNPDPMLGVASPKLLFAGTDDERGRHRVQYAGAGPIYPYTGRSASTGYGERDDGRFDESGPTHLPHGAAMMVRRSVFEQHGCLPESYFLYYEEHDFATRVREAGVGIRYVAESTVLHEASVSVGRDSPLKAFYMTRNRLLFLRRRVDGVAFLMSAFVFWFLALPKRLLQHLLRGERAQLTAAWAGAAEHLQGLVDPAEPLRPCRPRDGAGAHRAFRTRGWRSQAKHLPRPDRRDPASAVLS